MNLILLSGGSGKRLWPLSNDIRSKQFIKLFQKSNGSGQLDYESMLQRIYGQIKTVIPDADVTIATSKTQISAIHNQIGSDVSISLEPCRRDTFAAIALATAFLHDEKGVSAYESVVVCPVDPYVEVGYFECIKQMYYEANKGEKNLVLMGISPTYPSEKYGYIIPENHDGNVAYSFKEKPDVNTAAKYIAEGAIWNGGVFAYRLSYVLNKSKELLGTSDYAELFSNYANLKKISFDYAVVEKELSIEVLRYSGTWKDLGTWNTLSESMDEKVIGEGVLDDTCENVHVINELDVPILGMGLKDVVIGASPDGILVSDKKRSSFIKPFVDAFDHQIMFAEKSWGSYRVLDIGKNSLTVKVTLNPGHMMNYHSHERRDEVWSVISGDGFAIVDGKEHPIKIGDVINLPIGVKHTVFAGPRGLQPGQDIKVEDKKKYDLPILKGS